MVLSERIFTRCKEEKYEDYRISGVVESFFDKFQRLAPPRQASPGDVSVAVVIPCKSGHIMNVEKFTGLEMLG